MFRRDRMPNGPCAGWMAQKEKSYEVHCEFWMGGFHQLALPRKSDDYFHMILGILHDMGVAIAQEGQRLQSIGCIARYGMSGVHACNIEVLSSFLPSLIQSVPSIIEVGCRSFLDSQFMFKFRLKLHCVEDMPKGNAGNAQFFPPIVESCIANSDGFLSAAPCLLQIQSGGFAA